LNLVAPRLGFQPAELDQTAAVEHEAPKVELGLH
jgi:hypothetical protein